jgi:Oxidoreductase family, NAD-binding Rossmann fold
MEMNTIAIIGAGQLGSRHLQGLSRLGIKASLYIVDTQADSLAIANARFDEMPFNKNISSIRYLDLISDLPKKIDLAIIATNSNVRANVIKSLLEYCEIGNMILEKVLFQKISDYEEIGKLLIAKKINCWVNHPRRMFPYYAKLANALIGSKKVSYKVQGGCWGLACNALHFIDHLAFLTGDSNLTVNASGLNPWVTEGRRRGYLEVDGVLSGKINNHPFELICHENVSPLLITICTDSLSAVIDEQSGRVKISKKENNWQWIEEDVKIVYFQSELSNKLAEDIYLCTA